MLIIKRKLKIFNFLFCYTDWKPFKEIFKEPPSIWNQPSLEKDISQLLDIQLETLVNLENGKSDLPKYKLILEAGSQKIEFLKVCYSFNLSRSPDL